ncbi:CHASE3 domain-containing protein [Pseudoalteromonas denitrificans]|uniref:Sensory/regulatory protein RpfC n=1 Tax=Pseudoalteromonas denitrificans DSM 6059 TaxID=1123010 RepID=A0A1I1DWQ0_9GAMM|nr:CHASE3 domain-containing protein [Pseudoalteromonas denitrificans]SFB79489.1 Signal transduction histidine kinase [Pseudoalteromonas denitrificans DSM 6059]
MHNLDENRHGDKGLFKKLIVQVDKMSLTYKILSGFAIPVILMIIVSSVVYNSTTALIETSNWVTHTQKVIAKGHLLEKLLLDMETGERGFLITGKNEFLEPFINSEKQWDTQINSTKTLVSDNFSQVKKVESIDLKAKQWLKLAATPEMALRRKVVSNAISLDHLQTLLQKKTGKNIQDGILKKLDDLNHIFSTSQNQIASNLLISISKDIVDQETGERGFLITGDEDFLSPYKEGQLNYQAHISELKSLILNSPKKSQVTNLINKIEMLANQWETKVATPEIDMRRTIKNIKKAEAELENIAEVVSIGIGKKILDELRKNFNILKDLYIRSNNEKAQLLLTILSKSMVDRESGQRGYLITGEDRFLQSYEEGKQIFEFNLQLIKKIAANAYDEKVVYQLVEEIEVETAKWHKLAASVEIDARREINQTGLSPMEYLQKMQSSVLNSEYLLSIKTTLSIIDAMFTKNTDISGRLILSNMHNTLYKLKTTYLQFSSNGDPSLLIQFNKQRRKLTKQIISLSFHSKASISAKDSSTLKQHIENLSLNASTWFTQSIEPRLHSRKNAFTSRSSALNQIQHVLRKGRGKNILDDIRLQINNMNKKAIDEKNYQVSNLILQISKAIVDQETGQRGFIITGQEAFLEPYYLGNKNLSYLIAELKNNVNQGFNSKEVIEKFKIIEDEIKNWRQVAAEPEIKLRRLVNQGEENYINLVRIASESKGKNILENIRYLQNELNKDFLKAKHITAQRLIVSIAKDIADMEAGQRGFLITGQEEFLQSYQRGLESLKQHTFEIKNIINASSDISKMQSDIDLLRQKTVQWKLEAAEPEIALRNTLNKAGASMEDVTRLIENGTGKKIIDSLREEIAQFIQVEKDLILVRTFESQQAASDTLYQAIFGTLSAAITAFFSAFILLKSILGSLTKLSDATKKVATGDYNARIKIYGQDQVAELTNSFNSMTSQLEESSRDMKSSKKDLQMQAELLEEKNTQLLHTQGELEKNAVKLEQTSQYKSNFLATMSHEIRTPMNGVLGMLGLLKNTDLTSDQLKKVQVAKSSADALLTIINEILDFSKIESGKLELEILDFNLRSMLGDFSESMAIQAQEKGLEIVLDVTNIEESMVIGDPGRLRQILVNLVGNAIKFTQNGEVVIHAKTEKTTDDTLLFICNIEDTGIGIEQEYIGNLFEVFTQADSSTTREYGGTGLGLSISKKLCELMDGHINVTSIKGQGSKFEICVKLKKSQRSQLVIPQVDISQLHLLVVDDNATNRMVLRGQLEYWGAKVTEVDSAKSALNMCQQQISSGEPLYDVAYLDMQMPQMSGAQLAEQIRSNKAFDSMKMVMMTSISHSDGPQYFSDLGFSAFFPKPVTTSDIFDSLNIVVEGGETLKQAGAIITHNYINSLKHENNELSPISGRFLLVEDNIINQQVALGILQEFGFEADIAVNGIEALRLLKESLPESPYSLILMDCQMPEMDGYEASNLIREGNAGSYYKSIPIIAMTANAMQGDREKCIQVGMSDYLTKPIEPDMLQQKIVHWLKERPSNVLSIKPLQVKKEAEQDKYVTEEKPIWDKASMSKRVMNNDKLVNKLIVCFLNEMPDRIHEIESLKVQSDSDTLGIIAHTIKGVSANLSAMHLADKAEILELACKQKNCINYSQMVDDLVTSYTQLKLVLEKFQLEEKTEHRHN